MKKFIEKFKKNQTIIFLLTAALLIRIAGIFDGLPATYNSTEYLLAKVALQLGADRTIDPGLYIYPTFYIYILFVLYSFYFGFGWILGYFSDIYSFGITFLIEPSAFYIIPRLFNILICLAAVYLTYQMLSKDANRRVAGMTATMLVISSYMIFYSYNATADMLLIFFSLMTYLYFYRLFRQYSARHLFYTGLFAGLAIGAKYNAGFLPFGLFILVFLLWRKKRVALVTGLTISLGGVLAGFIITNPLWLVYPDRFIEGFYLISAQMVTAISAEQGDPFLWEIITLIKHEFLIGILFIASTIYYFMDGSKKHLPALVVILFTFFYVGSWSKKGLDYLFAIYPAWMIISAFFVDQFLTMKKKPKWFSKLIMTVIFVPSLIAALHHNLLLFNQDTREQATIWLLEHYDKSQTVCYDNSHYDLAIFDINRYTIYGDRATHLPNKIKTQLRDYSNHPRQVFLVPILVSNPSCTLKTENPYETQVVKMRRRTLSELMQMGVDYLITNSWYYQRFLQAELDEYPLGVQIGIREVKLFYEQLKTHFKPVKDFEPDFMTAGPELRIYKISND